MNGGLRRSLADLACRALQATLPSSLRSWGLAIRYETAGIPSDTGALLFALSSLCGLLPRAVASRLFPPFAALIGVHPFSGGPITMNSHDAALPRPRAFAIACMIGAVLLGLAYLAIAGAPARYLATNAGALAVGLGLLALLGRVSMFGRLWAGGAIIAMAGALLATAVVGAEADGATRWVKLGGLAIQPSLVFLPVMLVAFAQTRTTLAAAGIVIAAAAMALQPDRAMAGMLALSLAVLAAMRRDRQILAALAAGVVSFAATLVRADAMPAVPHVDQILYSSFAVHAGAGLAVLGGSLLLLLPALAGWRRDAENRTVYAVFGAAWFAAIMAAALGNYPTPIVGYGGSAIIGYALSLVALPRLGTLPAQAGLQVGGEAGTASHDQPLLAGVA